MQPQTLLATANLFRFIIPTLEPRRNPPKCVVNSQLRGCKFGVGVLDYVPRRCRAWIRITIRVLDAATAFCALPRHGVGLVINSG
jgi:hypothetical protein